MHLASRAACVAVLALGLHGLAARPSEAAETRRHAFIVLGNPVSGREDEFVTWYSGQHFHDLLNIQGVVAAQFFRLSDPQYREGQPHPYRYMVIWEIETDDLPAVFLRIQQGLATGTTVRSSAMDRESTNNTFTPVTERITAEQARGRSVAEVLHMSTPAR
jgi:hypothetical protein